MKNLNLAVQEGNIIKQPVLRVTPNGTSCLSFTIAVNSDYKKDNEWVNVVAFIDITVWGKYADSLNERLAKGVCVICKGRIKQDNWKDRDTGANRSKLSITADEVSIRNRVASTESTKQNDYPKMEKDIPEYKVPEGAEKYTGPSDLDIPF